MIKVSCIKGNVSPAFDPSSCEESGVACFDKIDDVLLEELRTSREEIISRIKDVVSGQNKGRKKPLDDFERSVLWAVFGANQEGYSVTLPGICRILEVPKDQEDFYSDAVLQLRDRIRGSLVGLVSKRVFSGMNEGGMPGLRTSYCVEIADPLPEVDEEKAFHDPIHQMSEDEWSVLLDLLSLEYKETVTTGTVVRQVIECLIDAVKERKAVSKEYVRAKICQMLEKRKTPGEFENIIAYMQIDIADRFEDRGFKIVDKIVDGEDLLQPVLTKSIDQCGIIPRTDRGDQFGGIDDSVKVRIKDVCRHLGGRDLPVEKILSYIFFSDGCSLEMIINKMRKKGHVVTKAQLRKLFATINKLNMINKDFSPIGINVYGNGGYHIEFTPKAYVSALGDYDYHSVDSCASLYPQSARFRFNYESYRRILQEKAPHLILGESNVALIAQAVAAYSTYGFKISLPIIFNIVKKRRSELNRKFFAVEVKNLKSYVSKELAGFGICMSRDEKGYCFTTNDIGESPRRNASSWPDYVHQENFELPEESMTQCELWLRREESFEISPDILVMIKEWKSRLPCEFSEEAQFRDVLPVKTAKNMNFHEQKILLDEVLDLAEGSITHKTGEQMPARKQAILLQLLMNSIRGQGTLVTHFASGMGVTEDRDAVRKDFLSMYQTINSTGRTHVKIRSIKLPTKIDNKDVIYFLELR